MFQSHFRKFYVKFCVKTLCTDTNTTLKEKSRISDARRHIRSKDNLKHIEQFIPDRFFRIKRSPIDYNFIIEDEIAEKIAKILEKYLKGSIPVIEANPGLGLLTRQFLDKGVKKLIIFDPLINQMTPLRDLISAKKLICLPVDLFQVGRFVARDKIDNGDRFETMFKDIPQKNWKDEPAAKLVGILLAKSYITYLLRSIAFRDVYTKLGRIEHFLIISDEIFKRQLSGNPIGRLRTSLLFKCFFDIEVLDEFPRTAILPWDKHSIDSNTENAILIRATPKPNLFDEFSSEDSKIFWYFISGITQSKKTKVIAYFENWAPTSGLILIKHGLSPLTEIRDLDASELLKLFRIFRNLAQFDEEHYIHMQDAELLSSAETVRSAVIKDE